MAKIQILPEEVINKIRAGEVVENPASVVKELVENALDAGAGEIHIAVKNGGLQEILVSDNGIGMSPENALYSIRSHATSKISRESDLENILTMGFRGEALSSIVSVAKLEIITKEKNAEAAFRLYCDGGSDLQTGAAARKLGTTVKVGSLFFNAPARKRFQKSPTGSAREIRQLIKKLVLSRPDVSFSFFLDRQKSLEVKSGAQDPFEAMKKRIKEVLGEEKFQQMQPINAERGPIRILGMAGNPLLTNPTQKEAFFIVNKRVVYCQELAKTVKEAYATGLDAGRFPVYVLYIDLPPSYIDVNVHPQKREIKLRSSKKEEILQFLGDSVAKVLFGRQTPPNLHVSFPAAGSRSNYAFAEQMEDLQAPALFSVPSKEEEISLFQEKTEKILGLAGQYLCVEGKEKKLFLVDLPRSNEFLFGQALLDSLCRQMPIENQKLLFPIQLSYSSSEAKEITAQISNIKYFGIDIRTFGEKEFLIEALTPFIEEKDVREYIETLLDMELPFKEISMQLPEKLSKLSVFGKRRKRAFTISEAETIYRRIQNYPDPRCCKGLPLIKILSQEDIYELFKKN